MVIRRSHWLVLGGLLSLLVPVQAQQAQQAQMDDHCIVVSPNVPVRLKAQDGLPKYPKEAKAKRLEGVVRLQATIDRKGRIAKLKVAQGDPILAKAAVKAVKQWRYRPYLVNGEPAELETTIEVLFHR